MHYMFLNDEKNRIDALKQYAILDTAPESCYDDIVRLAATLCNAPISLISLVDTDRQWFKASFGLEAKETPRKVAFCAHAIQSVDPLIVEDATQDPRFRNNPLVCGVPNIRFYSGYPLITPEGFALGTLCVIDVKPRVLDEEQKNALQILAKQVVSQLELRKSTMKMQETHVILAKEREQYANLVNHLKEVVFQTDANGLWTFLNPAWKEVMDYEVEESLGKFFLDYIHPDDRDLNTKHFETLVSLKKDFCRHRIRYVAKGGEIRWIDVFARLTISEDGAIVGTTGTLTDVTDFVASQHAASDREESLKSFFDASPFMMGIVELRDNKIIHISENAATKQFFSEGNNRNGPIDAEALGAPIDHIKLWIEKYKIAQATREPVYFRYWHRSPNGNFWLDAVVNLISIDDNQVPKFSYIAIDRTKEKEKDQILEDERRQLELITSNLGDVIWMRDVEQKKITYISPAFEKIWEQSCRSLIENPDAFLSAVHPEDRKRIDEARAKQVLGTYHETFRIVTASGKTKWILARAFPVKDKNGKVFRIVGIASEFTETKEQNEKFEMIVNHIPIAIVFFNEKGEREWVNPEWQRMLGWTFDETKDKDLYAELYPDPVQRRIAREHLQGSTMQWKDFETRTKSGSVIPASWVSVKLSSGKRIGLGQDISIRRAQEKLIAEQRSKMAHSSRLSALGEMAAGIAHEINNPLAIIRAKTELILSQLETDRFDRVQIHENLQKVDTTVVRIAKIIAGLRSFARDGESDPFYTVSMQSIVTDALELCQAKFRNHLVKLTVEMPDEPIFVECRSVQIAQVLLNLLNNAFDAVKDSQVKMITIQLREKLKHAYVSVSDTGSGISEAIKDKIMQPFFTTKGPGKGTGLGLSLSKGIVESHGGSLAYTCEQGQTSFSILLPKKQALKAA